jgi:hypothetical protein
MKFSPSIKKSTGIGLIEVLVTTVVIAVGLLAVASLQGDLIGGSRINKTRAEAKALADTKIEQLRDTIEKTGTTGHDELASSGSLENLDGITETFKRAWVVTDKVFDLTDQTWVLATFDSTTEIWKPDPTIEDSTHTYAHQNAKEINVTVCWSDGCPNTNNPENQIVVQSVIAFDGVGNSVLAAQGAGQAGTSVGGPSTNANSSDEITETIDLPTPTDGTTPPASGSVVTVNGKNYIVLISGSRGIRADLCSAYNPALSAYENDLYTRRVDHDGVSGNEAIELYEKVVAVQDGVAGEFCIPRIRYNGGVIIPIRGIVHSGATTGSGQNQTLLDVNLFTFNATETGTYCVFRPEANAKSAPYVCYVGGNCEFGPDGVDPNGSTNIPVTECPDPAVSAAIVGPGGWRGKVGLLGVASNGRNVCFGEEVGAAPATLDTARDYFTRRSGLNEGINKPYSCHDFLIINGQSTEEQIHTECAIQATAIAGLTLASKEIQRTITSGNNVFDPVINEDYCAKTSYTITGTITNANSVPSIAISPTGSCTATPSSYTCTILTSGTLASVTGSYNNETVHCELSSLSTVSANTCDLTFTPTTNPSYTITGSITGTAIAANAVSLSMSDGGSCTNNNGTYTCLITTSPKDITLTASIMTGATVAPNTAQTITLPDPSPDASATLTGPSFSASGVYTISGTISIANQVTDLSNLTVAVNTGAGACTLTGNHESNTTDTYSCIVPAGINKLTIAISPWCSTGSGSKKYQMSDNTIITIGTGSWVKDFSNITGDVTQNISITKTNTNC